jgi:rubredoxin
MEKWECAMCEYTYDPAKGDTARGIAPGTPFDDLPNNWTCPKCGAGKNLFTEA